MSVVLHTGPFRVYANVVSGKPDWNRSCCIDSGSSGWEICVPSVSIQGVNLNWHTNKEANDQQAKFWLYGVGTVMLEKDGSAVITR